MNLRSANSPRSAAACSLLIAGAATTGAAALKGLWFLVGDLVFGIALTCGARAFAFYLAANVERPLPRPR